MIFHDDDGLKDLFDLDGDGRVDDTEAYIGLDALGLFDDDEDSDSDDFDDDLDEDF